MKLEFALSGEHHTCVVSLAAIPQNSYLTCRISGQRSHMLNLNQWPMRVKVTADVKVMLLVFTFVTREKLLFVIAVFCDYYNTPGDCEWHYKSCGADCMKTCRNPSGNCSKQITALEGKVESSFFVMLHLNLFFSVWGWSNLTLTLMYFNSVLRCTTKDFCCNLLYVFWQQITCLALKNIFDYSVPL